MAWFDVVSGVAGIADDCWVVVAGRIVMSFSGVVVLLRLVGTTGILSGRTVEVLAVTATVLAGIVGGVITDIMVVVGYTFG